MERGGIMLLFVEYIPLLPGPAARVQPVHAAGAPAGQRARLERVPGKYIYILYVQEVVTQP